MIFFDEISELSTSLSNQGVVVYAPIKEGSGVDYELLNDEDKATTKQGYLDKHIEKIKKSDAILVANYTKNSAENYIGANTFLEMAFAYILDKKIFILNSIPEQPNKVEILGMKPIVLNGDISKI